MVEASKKPKWHLIYYALAAIDVLTIACSIYLNHLTLSKFTAATEMNTAWVVQLENFEQLATLATEVNAPGNDVFDSLNVPLERKRKADALQRYQSAHENAVTHVGDLNNASQRKALLQQLNASYGLMLAMTLETDRIFKYFEIGDPVAAATRMATMDRTFAELTHAHSGLRESVRNYQKENLANQINEAKTLQKTEYVLAGIVLLIVISVGIYGHALSRRIAETESLIAKQRATLESSSRLSSLGTMSAGIAHEINNPLTIILGQTQQLQRKSATNELTTAMLSKKLEQIESTCQRIASIVAGLRTFSRDGSKDGFQSVTLAELIRMTMGFCNERLRNHGVELRLPTSIPDLSVQCREVQISQVLINLVGNACDAVAKTTDPWVAIGVEATDHTVRIAVTDSGHGIPKEVAEKLFQPFFTTKEVGKGTGLGLSISHGIAGQHRGRLYVDENCANTRFVLEIPLKQHEMGVVESAA